MERIKEALDRAKKARGGSGAWSSDAKLEANPWSRRVHAPDGFNYTRTRSVTLSQDVLTRRRIVIHESGSSADAYRILGSQVLQRMQAQEWNTLAITSAGAGEGKTITAINLAISLAMGVDRTVLLVDADLRAPRLHSVLGLPQGPGLSDYLISDVPLEQILVHPSIGKLVVLPGGKALTNSSEMLASRKMASLVQELKTRYSTRYVIFDLPPLLNAADALAFSPMADAVLLVVEDSKTRREDVARAAQLLGRQNLLGLVLNKARRETWWHD